MVCWAGLWIGMCSFPVELSSQTAMEPEFSANLKKAAPEFEWISSEAVRLEVLDVLANHRSTLGAWAQQTSEKSGLYASLKLANLPTSLRYLLAAIGISETMLGQEDHRNGPWMIHSSVAAKYGLLLNSCIDERFDPELGMVAALSHLGDLWQEFKPSSLAVLAFLSSPANVRQAQYRSCDVASCRSVLAGIEASTLQVYHRFLATLYLFTYHKELLHVQAMAPTTQIPHQILEQAEPLEGYIALLSEDSLAFRRNNPHLFGKVIPLGARVYSMVQSPKNTLSSDQLKRYGFQRMEGRPDSLKAVMRQIKLDSESWFEFNGIDAEFEQTQVRMLLPLANMPLISEPISEEIPMVPPTREPQKPKPEPKSKLRYYTVRSGDTLWSISQKFKGVSHLDIQKANRMGNSDRIQPGQKLKIPN